MERDSAQVTKQRSGSTDIENGGTLHWFTETMGVKD